MQEAVERAQQLKSEGYKDVKAFYIDDESEEEITWEYVNFHLV